MMTFLKVIISRLTCEASFGSSWQVSDASVSVKCDAVTWEWKYRGKAFWEVNAPALATIHLGPDQPISESQTHAKL